MTLHQKKHPHLEQLLENARTVSLEKSSKVLILSDLHIGNGGRRDEFLRNADLVTSMLSGYYHPEGYSLLLNGDIEELFKFSLDGITSEWGALYTLFRSFQSNGFFWKTIGNHDAELTGNRSYQLASHLVDAIRLQYGDDSLLVFHGHQASVQLWETYPIFSRAVVFFCDTLPSRWA